MKKIIDISSKLTADAPELVIFGKTYTVKNDKTTVLLLEQLQRENATRTADGETNDERILKLLLGKEDGEQLINTLNSMSNYAVNERTVLFNVLALATGTPVETYEARFRKANELQ